MKKILCFIGFHKMEYSFYKTKSGIYRLRKECINCGIKSGIPDFKNPPPPPPPAP